MHVFSPFSASLYPQYIIMVKGQNNDYFWLLTYDVNASQCLLIEGGLQTLPLVWPMRLAPGVWVSGNHTEKGERSQDSDIL